MNEKKKPQTDTVVESSESKTVPEPQTKKSSKPEPEASVQVTQEPKKKSRGCLWTIIVLIFLGLFMALCSAVGLIFLAATSPSSSGSVLMEGSEEVIAVVRVDGVISSTYEDSLFGGTSGANDAVIVDQLNNLGSDPTVKAIIMRIESPGGEVVASDVISRKVLEVREKKPIVAYSSTMAASGGYMIASAADKIVIHPGSLTGSIGVILQTSSLEGLYEKLGIETVTFTSGQFKDDSQLFAEDSGGELDRIYMDLVDEAYEQFLEVIILGRGMDRTELERLADGRIYSGKQAVANGLADQEGYFEDAVDVAKDLSGVSNPTVIEYSDLSLWSGFFNSNPVQQILGFSDISAPLVGIYYLPGVLK